MVTNKKARQTLAIIAKWDELRPINNRLNNNVVVWLDNEGFILSLLKVPDNHYIDDFRNDDEFTKELKELDMYL